MPQELGSLPHLQQIYLGVNSLIGTIPYFLGNLSSLIFLDISASNLTGSIPPELGLLTCPQMLYLHTNELSGRIPASFNSNCIALIPKLDNPISLNDFKPISLCNCIYKVILKIIARRLKDILSEHISAEQFGFLKG